MRFGKGWIVVAVIVGLLLAGLSTTALAQPSTDAAGAAEGYSWEEMYAWCHGTEDGGGGMMGEPGTGMDWGSGGMGSGMMGTW